jgi:uncharacterized membrane protein
VISTRGSQTPWTYRIGRGKLRLTEALSELPEGMKDKKRTRNILNYRESRSFFERLKTYFWLVPSVVIVLLVALLYTLVQFEPGRPFNSVIASYIFRTYSADGARLILSAIAGTLMTVVGVLFSITIVVLQQVSSQYSPRVIQNFIRSTVSQLVLGLYVGTFIYCLLLLKQVPEEGGDANEALPHLAISAAIFLTIGCVALLIHYIHYVVHAIRSTNIVDTIRHETMSYLEPLADENDGMECAPEASVAGLSVVTLIKSPASGYLQGYDLNEIPGALNQGVAAVMIRNKPGDYVLEDHVLAEVRTDQPLSDQSIKELKKTFRLGKSRTYSQDVSYGIRQLVDVALRGLSPGIHDPTTAIEALNAVGSILHFFLSREEFPSRICATPSCQLRVPRLKTEELLAVSFHQVIMAAREQPPVLQRIGHILDDLIPVANTLERKEACLRLRDKVLQMANRADTYGLFNGRSAVAG